MPQTFLKTQKRRGQVSLVAVYLAVAVAVVGFVVSRFPVGGEEAETPVAEIESGAAVSEPVRLFRPEAFAAPAAATVVAESARAQLETSPLASVDSVNPDSVGGTGPASTGPASTGPASTGPASPEPVEAAEAVAEAIAEPATPKAAPVPPIQPLPSWTEKELLASLEEAAVELDLHSGSPSLVQVRSQIKTLADRFKRFNEKVARRDSFNRRVRRDPGDVLPGEQEVIAADVGTRPEEGHMIEGWIAKRPDLAGLPLRLDDSCKLDRTEASLLMKVSRSAIGLRTRMTAQGIHSEVIRKNAAILAANLIEDTSAIVQILQAEPAIVRTRMVKLLSMKEDEESIQALVDRALFDTSKEVRHLALHELKLQPGEKVREQLLDGFDHAWEPVAVNAANALVELDDELSVDDLRKRLGVPDPHAPYQDEKGNWKVRELVRVNHLRNCLLCHAPVVDPKASPFQAIVPEPTKPLPRMYYSSGSPSVRPDITYIVQDFSTTHEVGGMKPWPFKQRFDYFVRERVIDSTEALKRKEKRSEEESLRERALRYAIDKLSVNQKSEPSLAQNTTG